MTLVLGISDGHNASACLLKDGRIVACASEERFTRMKNIWGCPRKAIEYCMKEGRVTGDQLDLVVLHAKDQVMNLGFSYSPTFKGLYSFISLGASALSRWRRLYATAHDALAPTLSRNTKRMRIKAVVRLLGVDESKVLLMDHHLSHAYAGAFACGYADAVVLTNDGMGDSLCATVSVKSGQQIKTISKTHFTNSIAALYFTVTNYLGLKGNEDEHKVMGLAPYASDPSDSQVYNSLEEHFRVNEDLTFTARVPTHRYDKLVDRCCYRARFDQIAATIQLLTEDVLLEWVTKAVSKTGHENVVLSGGTFLNVKANLRIGELKSIKHLYIMPSPGDESNAIGTAYWGYLQLKPGASIRPLKDLYLGPSYGQDEIKEILETRSSRSYRWEKTSDSDSAISELLEKGRIVGRYDGRMEFGARALGNRSILARADDPAVVRRLNHQVKSRDFWMPFSPTVLEHSASDYLASPETDKVNSEYMIIGFRGTDMSRKHLIAATHLYDGTVRPQVLREGWNPSYEDLLRTFEERTGISGLLNTSFNLHGEPIVESPEDAISTFERSGLEHLFLGDYMLSKLS